MQIPPALAAFAQASAVPAATARKDWKVANGFAGAAIGELLRPMFATVDLANTRFGGGVGAATWKPILVAAIGRGIAARDGLGISATVFRSLLEEQQAGHGATQRHEESSDDQGSD